MSLSLVTCSKDDARCDRFLGWLSLLAREPDEIVRIPDAQSMCEGLTRGLSLVTKEHVVFCHDDVELLSPGFLSSIETSLVDHDVVGLAGTSRLLEGRWTSGGPPGEPSYLVGQSAHPSDPFHVMIYGPRFETTNVEAFDGCFFAAKRTVARDVGFDALSFDGWHFYDVDFSFSAARAGYDVVVLPDLAYIHHSLQPFGPDWARYRDIFEEKHGLHPKTRDVEGLKATVIQVASRDLVREIMEGQTGLARDIRARVVAAFKESE